MTKKLFSHKLEGRVIRTICENGEAGELLLGKISDRMIHSPAWQSAWQRIQAEMRRGDGTAPAYDVLSEDPRVSQDDREVIAGFDGEALPSHEVEGAVKMLGTYAATRGALELIQETYDKISGDDGMDIYEHLDQMQNQLTEIRAEAADGKDWFLGKGHNAKPVLLDILQGGKNEGIPTMFDTWDSVNGVIPDTALMIIAANTGGGKSIMASVMCRNLAEVGFRPAIVPLEMSKEQMYARLLASVTAVPVHKVLQGKDKVTENEMEKLKEKFNAWHKKCLKAEGTHILHEVYTNPTMTQVLHRLKHRDPDVIIIDYVALLDDVDGEDDWRKLAEASREAKMFAVAHKIPVVIVAQMGSDEDLRYSKRMKDHADIMWAWKGDKEAKENGIIEIKQLKCRNLDPFSFKLKIEWDITNIRDLTSEECKGSTDDDELTNMTPKEKKGK